MKDIAGGLWWYAASSLPPSPSLESELQPQFSTSPADPSSLNGHQSPLISSWPLGLASDGSVWAYQGIGSDLKQVRGFYQKDTEGARGEEADSGLVRELTRVKNQDVDLLSFPVLFAVASRSYSLSLSASVNLFLASLSRNLLSLYMILTGSPSSLCPSNRPSPSPFN